jgi:hypothetical protein
MARLARDPDEYVRSWAEFATLCRILELKHLKCDPPPENLAQLVKLYDEVRDHNAGTEAKAWAEPASDPDQEERLRVARNPQAPPEALAMLARGPDQKVRAAVARNPAAPAKALIGLASDLDREVRGGVAQHPAAPPEALAMLARGPKLVVQVGRNLRDAAKLSAGLFAAIIRRAVPAKVLTDLVDGFFQFIDDSDARERAKQGLREALARNPATLLEDLVTVSDK